LQDPEIKDFPPLQNIQTVEELYTVKENRNILYRVKGRKANWTCHILHRNCLLKHIIEGKTKG